MIRRGTLFWLAAPALVLTLAVSAESLWIDEAFTARFAGGDLSALEWMFLHHAGSEAQMPLFMLLQWLSARIFGVGEYALRMPNLLWGWLGLWAVWSLGRRHGMPWAAWVYALHPFLWFYMDEARPYVMQIAAGAWLLNLLDEGWSGGSLNVRWAASLGTAAFILCGASMLGAVPAGLSVAGTLWLLRVRGPDAGRATRAVLAAGLVLLGALGLYYLWTMARGAGGAKAWELGVYNAAFALYELGGFSGWGPGRVDMREAARAGHGQLVAAFLAFLPGLLFWLFCVVAAWMGGMRLAPGERRRWFAWSACLALGVAGLCVLAAVAGFPFWGRHLSGLLPLVVVVLAWGWRGWGGGRRRLIIGAGLAALTLASVQIRWAARHQKEDSRAAAGAARSALDRGETVWWSADAECARYYRLPLGSEARHARPVISLSAGELDQLPGPDLILLTKPDLFDARGALRARYPALRTPQNGGIRHFRVLRPDEEAQTGAMPASAVRP